MQHDTFLKTSTNEQVTLERWFFVAEYHDGTELRQFDDRDGTYHSFPEIDTENLATFKMVNSTTGQVLTVIFPHDAKLVHHYRNITLNFGTEEEESMRWYVFGYELKHINCKFVITHQNEIIFTDDPDAISVE